MRYEKPLIVRDANLSLLHAARRRNSIWMPGTFLEAHSLLAQTRANVQGEVYEPEEA